jgi:hypothetical protein
MEGRVERATAIRIDRQVVPAVSVIPAQLLDSGASPRLNAPSSSTATSFHSPPIDLVLRV